MKEGNKNFLETIMTSQEIWQKTYEADENCSFAADSFGNESAIRY